MNSLPELLTRLAGGYPPPDFPRDWEEFCSAVRKGQHLKWNGIGQKSGHLLKLIVRRIDAMRKEKENGNS